jgi:DNA-binding response OmpR family regulator
MSLLDNLQGTAQAHRILVVDDDPGMQRRISDYLEANGIRAAIAASRSEMSRLLASGHFDLVLLDLRLSQKDRDAGDAAGEQSSLRQLIADIQVVLRQRDAAAWPARDADASVMHFGKWSLDRGSRRLQDRKGRLVGLTRSEYALLLAFIEAPQRALSREHLLQACRVHGDMFERSINVQILRLRRKLEADPSHPRVIVTERGVGYVFKLDVSRG